MSDHPDIIHHSRAPGHVVTRRRRHVLLLSLVLLAYLGIMFGGFLSP